ncbi:MAG: stage V sporulation protein D [Candidatus Eremiobacteraeota bacterium]|nr:stage V sporulation protein D [Candidatus Eremiobacteraeota bacterium]MBC5826249.1 stage V sporulation protein D [Candidatus Eremiobacteraeota bacterium]
MKSKEKRRLRIRASLVFWIFCAIAGCLGIRLFHVQIRDGRALAADAGAEQRASFDVSGRRGDIVDRSGVPLAMSLPSFAVFAQGSAVLQPRAEAAALGSALGVAPQPVSLAFERPGFVYLARNVAPRSALRVERLALAGVGVAEEPLGVRVDPQGRSGSTLIGFTGVDNQGLAGVEYRFNDLLRGKPGTVVEMTDNAGRPIPFGRRVIKPAIVGDTVVLAIDRMLQYEAERILTSTVHRYQADDGAAIIMRAQTGEILALANTPNFDPNDFGKSPPSSWRDRAITDPYEPGSTFKLITAAAALDSGKVSQSDTFPAVDAIEVGRRTIHNADDGLMASGRPSETLDDIVAYSHNVGAAEIALRIGKRTLDDYIRRFGFDERTGVDLPGESAGIIQDPNDWWGSQIATIGFGQGISVTPLALARAYAAIANGGLLMRPLAVRSVMTPAGKAVKTYAPQVVRRVMRPETAAALMAILRDVVKRGTARAAKVPGYKVAGKTGTAQMVIDGSYVGGAYTASFIGIVPADRPQYVILVKVDHPHGAYYGSIVAMPAFCELARRTLWREGVLPDHVAGTVDGGLPARSASQSGALRGNRHQQR